RDRVEAGLLEPAVEPYERRGTDLDVDVGRALLHGKAQELIEVQHARVTSSDRSSSAQSARDLKNPRREPASVQVLVPEVTHRVQHRMARSAGGRRLGSDRLAEEHGRGR